MAMTAEQLWRSLLRGPLRTKAESAANQWAGRVTIASGTASAVVSTTSVASDALIFLTPYRNGNTAAASGAGRAWEVQTIVHGASFTVATIDGASAGATTVLNFQIIKVN